MNAINQQLEAIFRDIEKDRMQDMPMCNPALRVQAIGFSEWGEFYLGVMLTPWFMNLMLLPRDASRATDYQAGKKQAHVFPSGCYEFVMAEEAGLGPYQVCSLFSPVFEFTDQQTAVSTASQILDEVMKQENRETISTHAKTIKEYWQAGQNDEQEAEVAAEPILEQGIETPMSRRQLLRGMLPQQKVQERGD